MESNYTIEEVALHTTIDDIWLVIDQNVYDITDFIKEHPGGKDILLSFGGHDVTDFFHDLHNPSVLKDIAENYKIGEIY